MIVKKIAIAALLLVLFALMPIAFADDTNDIVDANTAQEIKVMATPFGAEVRLLQLDKSITKNILVGAKVIEVIQKNHPTEDVNTAQGILDQMEALLVDVKNVDLTADKNTLVVEFVAMKKEATDLSKQFREATATILTAEDRKEIKEAVKDFDKVQLKGINDEIKRAIRTHNAESIQALFDKMGISNPELIQKIVDGNATAAEVKQAVMNAYNDLNSDQKQLIGAKVKEGAIKRMVAEKQLAQNARIHAMNKILQRDQNKLIRINDWLKNKATDTNAKGFMDREQRLENLSNKINDINNKINEWQQKRGH